MSWKKLHMILSGNECSWSNAMKFTDIKWKCIYIFPKLAAIMMLCWIHFDNNSIQFELLSTKSITDTSLKTSPLFYLLAQPHGWSRDFTRRIIKVPKAAALIWWLEQCDSHENNQRNKTWKTTHYDSNRNNQSNRLKRSGIDLVAVSIR